MPTRPGRRLKAGDLLAATLRSGAAGAKAEVLQAIVAGVALGQSGVDISIARDRLLAALKLPEDNELAHAEPLLLNCAAVRVRRGHQLRLVIPGRVDLSAPPPTRNEKLVALVAEAQAARELVLAHPGKSMASIAASVNRCRTRLAKLVALSCLAPDIITAVVQGKQPAGLTSRSLMGNELPHAWAQQRVAFGCVKGTKGWDAGHFGELVGKANRVH